CQTVEDALGTAPVAGPQDLFRQEIARAASAALDQIDQGLDPNFAELVRRYAAVAGDAPSDEFPLPATDRAHLRALADRAAELRHHHFGTGKKLPDNLEAAFWQAGPPAKPRRRPVEDLDPADVWAGFRRVAQRLGYLLAKHAALRRVREVCRVYQQKW